MLNKPNKFLILLYAKGYRVKENVLYNPKREILSKHLDNRGYYYHNFSIAGTSCNIRMHRMVAYQKYGYELFEPGILVRHKDSNKLNNFEDNILIGTASDNMLDIPKEKRIEYAKNASKNNRTFTPKEVRSILNDRKKGMTYKQLCEKYNTRKSSLSYLFNKALYKYDV